MANKDMSLSLGRGTHVFLHTQAEGAWVAKVSWDVEPGCNQPSELQLCGGKLGVERGADKHWPKRADGEEEAAREEEHLLASCSHG